MTDDELKSLIDMVANWREGNRDLRFGQWLWVICKGDPFYVEDDVMVENMKQWFETVDEKPQDLAPLSETGRVDVKTIDGGQPCES